MSGDGNSYVIMGATGHVGSAVAAALLDRGQSVTVIMRDLRHAGQWREKGADVAVADIADVESLHQAFCRGRRAFLLNPPGDTADDSDALERASIAHILAALEGSGLEKIVAESTMGARPGVRTGDLTTLWQLEEGLRQQSFPAAINRAAYYMSNWDTMLETVRTTGKLTTLFPPDLKLPMVAPEDLGFAAADRLQSPVSDAGIRDIEGPESYSSQDVATAFAENLGRPVETVVIPREEWINYYQSLGFSQLSAESYARMSATVVDSTSLESPDPIRGKTTLHSYIRALVQRPASSP